jgi:hypothetical protein
MLEIQILPPQFVKYNTDTHRGTFATPCSDLHGGVGAVAELFLVARRPFCYRVVQK